ncbi:MAG: penicillin-binding protein 2 [Candidatus Pelagibacter sp.]|nr:penicillin-binding protein 2 [Candidatus Pelagibacter sp.]
MKKNKQLNLYFSEQPELTKKKNDDGRNNIIISFFIIFFLIICLRLVFLGFERKTFVGTKNYEGLFYERRDVVDNQGSILAKNISTFDLVLRKNKVKNFDNVLLKVKLNFPKVNINYIKLNYKDKNTLVLKKNLSPSDYNKITNLGEPSLELFKREIRIYPHKNLFAHILGKIDSDNYGISGIEMYMDDQLRDKSKVNIPVQLSLNTNIQYSIHEELMKGVKDFSAIGAAAILMDANTGKIISMVSLPDADNNLRNSNQLKNNLSRATKGLYELGSVFKTFAIASAIENKVISKDMIFSNLRNRVYCGKFPIDEYRWDKSKKELTVQQILVKSSNIGTIEIVKKNGLENQQNFLENLEIFDMPRLEIPELSKSKKNRWGKCNTLTSAYGHGVSTTLLQLTRAYAAIVNGGVLLDSSILLNKKLNKKRVISKETSVIMNQMLRANVDKKNKTSGSGRKADIVGYDVLGKTGTAQKPSKKEKGYSKEILNVFASAFPSKKPKYVLTVLIDEPKGAPQIWKHSRREAGWNAVYIAGKIIRKIGPSLAINDLDLLNNYASHTKNN